MIRGGPGGDGPRVRHCGNCGQPLGADAVFCRACGERFEEPAAPRQRAGASAGAGKRRSSARNRAAFWVAGAIVLAGAGAALAILLSSGGSSSTTVLVDSDGSQVADTNTEKAAAVIEAPPPEPIEAGLYVQSGSFRTASNADEEADRLTEAGIDVEVVYSDGAEEFYPGFQVLLVGPVQGNAEEKEVIKALDENGVSAYARGLSPARGMEGAGEAGGEWTGVLERSSGDQPGLNDSLTVVLDMDPDGLAGSLEVPAEGCSGLLALTEESPTTLTYSQNLPCVSSGDLRIRPTEGQLMVSILPLDSDVLVTGTLTPR